MARWFFLRSHCFFVSTRRGNQRWKEAWGLGGWARSRYLAFPPHGFPCDPLLLCRLLGPSAAADILQLSSSLPLQSRGRARLLVGNDDVHIIARSDDELLDDFFHDQSTATSQAGALAKTEEIAKNELSWLPCSFVPLWALRDLVASGLFGSGAVHWKDPLGPNPSLVAYSNKPWGHHSCSTINLGQF